MIRSRLVVLLLLAGCATAPVEIRPVESASDVIGTWVLRDRAIGNRKELTLRADGSYCESEVEGKHAVVRRGAWEVNFPGHLGLVILESTDPDERIGDDRPLGYEARFEGKDSLVLEFPCMHCEILWPHDRAKGPHPDHGCATQETSTD